MCIATYLYIYIYAYLYIYIYIYISDIFRGHPCFIVFSRKLKIFRTVGFLQAFAPEDAWRVAMRKLGQTLESRRILISSKIDIYIIHTKLVNHI